MIHELKTWPMYFREVKSGAKPFEVRKNDRNFQVGDEVLLREYCPENYYEEGDKADYTGEILHRKISYILKGGQFGIDSDTVILGLSVCDHQWKSRFSEKRGSWILCAKCSKEG